MIIGSLGTCIALLVARSRRVRSRSALVILYTHTHTRRSKGVFFMKYSVVVASSSSWPSRPPPVEAAAAPAGPSFSLPSLSRRALAFYKSRCCWCTFAASCRWADVVVGGCLLACLPRTSLSLLYCLFLFPVYFVFVCILLLRCFLQPSITCTCIHSLTHIKTFTHSLVALHPLNRTFVCTQKKMIWTKNRSPPLPPSLAQ